MAQKKSFTKNLNPAMQFISTAEETKPEVKTETFIERAEAPKGYKLNPVYIETKSKRLQLLVQPSLYEKVKAIADRENKSVNELIHSILEEATREE
ncbi:MAG: hypothetical protein IJ298_04050 [Ruminococcus sp.]|nr:hypothetical protein [Ruminococcus sp.]